MKRIEVTEIKEENKIKLYMIIQFHKHESIPPYICYQSISSEEVYEEFMSIQSKEFYKDYILKIFSTTIPNY